MSTPPDPPSDAAVPVVNIEADGNDDWIKSGREDVRIGSESGPAPEPPPAEES